MTTTPGAAPSPFPAAPAVAPISLVQRHEVLSTPWWVVRNDDVVFASGASGKHIVFEPTNGERAGSVALAVLQSATGPRVALVHAFRYPLGRWSWELPRGFADPQDPDGLSTAVRELVEETGAVGVSTTDLGHIHPDTGPLRSRVDVVAVRVDHAGSGPVDDEVDSVIWVDVPTLYQAIADGTITCGMSIAAVMRAQLTGILPLPQ